MKWYDKIAIGLVGLVVIFFLQLCSPQLNIGDPCQEGSNCLACENGICSARCFLGGCKEYKEPFAGHLSCIMMSLHAVRGWCMRSCTEDDDCAVGSCQFFSHEKPRKCQYGGGPWTDGSDEHCYCWP